MNERPTPDQIARFDFDGTWGDSTPFPSEAGHRVQLLATVREHGYVIFHPDDVPTGAERYGITEGNVQRFTWDECRSYIEALGGQP